MYQPVFSPKTGWIVGVIDNHVAKPLIPEEVDRVCELLNNASLDIEIKVKMVEAIKYYHEGIDHFYKCIDFGKSTLDAEAISFMNESNIKLRKALDLINTTLEMKI